MVKRGQRTSSCARGAEDGGVITVLHEDAGVDPVERFNTSDGSVVFVDNRHVQIFSQYVASEGGRRWRVNKWA